MRTSYRVSFNPRSRGGSDVSTLYTSFGNKVSIHAPVVGATSSNHKLRFLSRVSIHAPVVGATYSLLTVLQAFICFNPRSRGGSDPPQLQPELIQNRFNPRSRGGSDAFVKNPLFKIVSFNPRSRGGSDIKAGKHVPYNFGFNPRSRGGSDLF